MSLESCQRWLWAAIQASSDDFEYMRVVKPSAESDEDGFLFLSDAFVRRVTSPRACCRSRNAISSSDRRMRWRS